MIDTEKDGRKLVERALLIGFQDVESGLGEAKEHLAELGELARTLGVPVLDRRIVSVKQPKAKYLLGAGKAGELATLADEIEADCLIFDTELTPSQQRNWEALTKKCVIDRQEIILDIFAERATTREAIIQVDLARMRYALPRLTRAWTHLSRQKGGAKGTRGEGEKQIEVDRRLVQDRIAALRRELKEVRRHRVTQRKLRERKAVPHGAIVGYTNAGKSSLLNALSGSEVLVEDKLFATLDPTTRRIPLSGAGEILLTDTVGFVRKLPHLLVEAFKSTLEEAALADFVIHVIDATSHLVEENFATTMSVLTELDAGDKPMLTVFNKIDLLWDPMVKAKLRALFPGCVFISTHSGEGLDELRFRLSLQAGKNTRYLRLRIPPSRHDVAAMAHREASVIATEYDDEGFLLMNLSVSDGNAARFAEFMRGTEHGDIPRQNN